MRARVVDDAGELAVLTPAWQDLWQRSPAATPFQLPGWLVSWWQAFHPGELRTVAVERENRLLALAPLYLEDGPYGRRLLPLGISLSDHLDLLLDPDEPAAASMLLGAIADLPGWDAVSLEDLAPDAAALTLQLPASFNDEIFAQTACPSLALSGAVDSDGTPLDVPPKRRQTLRRAWRAAERRGGFTVREGVDPALFLGELFRLHALRWEARGESGVLANWTVQAFHRAALPQLAATHTTRLNLLDIGGVTVGAYYGFLARGVAYAYVNGFDPAYEEESPSTILFGHAMADAVRAGCSRFDFLRGQEPYKYLWGAEDLWNQCRILRRS